MTTVKTYGWLSPEKLKFINETPVILNLLYDLGLLPEEISAKVRGYVEEERERCAKIADGFGSKAGNDAAGGMAHIIAQEIRKS